MGERSAAQPVRAEAAEEIAKQSAARWGSRSGCARARWGARVGDHKLARLRIKDRPNVPTAGKLEVGQGQHGTIVVLRRFVLLPIVSHRAKSQRLLGLSARR